MILLLIPVCVIVTWFTLKVRADNAYCARLLAGEEVE